MGVLLKTAAAFAVMFALLHPQSAALWLNAALIDRMRTHCTEGLPIYHGEHISGLEQEARAILARNARSTAPF